MQSRMMPVNRFLMVKFGMRQEGRMEWGKVDAFSKNGGELVTPVFRGAHALLNHLSLCSGQLTRPKKVHSLRQFEGFSKLSFYL